MWHMTKRGPPTHPPIHPPTPHPDIQPQACTYLCLRSHVVHHEVRRLKPGQNAGTTSWAHTLPGPGTTLLPALHLRPHLPLSLPAPRPPHVR